jgi:hypothetical protein
MNAEAKVKAATLNGALVNALAEIGGASKDKLNPHFKSKYADLSSVTDAIKPVLAKYGLGYTQHCHPAENGVSVETVVRHEGGEQESLGTLFVPANKQDAQGFGSALTYCRRYALMTAFGVPAEDDDGNAAAASAPKAVAANRPVPADDSQRDLIAQLAPTVGKTVQSICEAYRIQSLKELTYTQAESVIARLRAPVKEPANA